MSNRPLLEVSPTFRFASGIEPNERLATTIYNHSVEIQENQSNHGPILIELSPSSGSEGTVINVLLQSLPSHTPVKLAFNRLLVETKCLHGQGLSSLTSLVATVPSFEQVDSITPNVPIAVCCTDNDMVTKSWVIAEFTYYLEDNPIINEQKSIFNSPETQVNYTTDTSYNNVDLNGLIIPFQTNASAYENLSYNNNLNTQISGYQHYDSCGQYILNFFPTSSNDSFTSLITHGLDQVSNNFNQIQQDQKVHSNVDRIRCKRAYRKSYNIAVNKTRIKSILDKHVGSVVNSQQSPSLTNQINIDIIGDLGSMTKNWTAKEISECRRLVQFKSEQIPGKIIITFQPIPSEQIVISQENTIVSCIQWRECNDFYITSVDCIYLLGRLLNENFQVDEKNRIRRNLECYRPLTIHKTKKDTAKFFNVIMGLDNPKPRNIAKNIKVFRWSIISVALKKLLNKYTTNQPNRKPTAVNYPI